VKHRRRLLFIAAIFFLIGFTFQCAQKSTQKEALPVLPSTGALPEVGSAAEEEMPLKSATDLYAEITPAEIPKEIARLLPVIRKSGSDREAMTAHLQLAWLYGHYKNPSPQYLKALQELDAYLSLDHDAGSDDFVRNWHKTLKEIARLSKENKDLREKAEQLKDQVKQLEHLDVEMEKRRQDVK
jgi:hypothetical protein